MYKLKLIVVFILVSFQIKAVDKVNLLLKGSEVGNISQQFSIGSFDPISDGIDESEIDNIKSGVKSRNYIIGITLLMFLISTTFALSSYVQIRQLKQISKYNHTILAGDKEELLQKLETKNKELASKSMMIAQSQEMMGYVAEKLKNKSEKKEEQNDEPEIKEILEELNSKKIGNTWEEFEKRFLEVHLDFYTNLKIKYPGLTPNEIKLCAFLKLNMSNKEISKLTYQSTRALEVARYRIRKKLKLTRSQSLSSVLFDV